MSKAVKSLLLATALLAGTAVGVTSAQKAFADVTISSSANQSSIVNLSGSQEGLYFYGQGADSTLTASQAGQPSWGGGTYSSSFGNNRHQVTANNAITTSDGNVTNANFQAVLNKLDITVDGVAYTHLKAESFTINGTTFAGYLTTASGTIAPDFVIGIIATSNFSTYNLQADFSIFDGDTSPLSVNSGNSTSSSNSSDSSSAASGSSSAATSPSSSASSNTSSASSASSSTSSASSSTSSSTSSATSDSSSAATAPSSSATSDSSSSAASSSSSSADASSSSSAASSSAASSDSTTATNSISADSNGSTTAVAPTIPDGWDNAKDSYYVNGEKLIGEQYIDGYWYLFNKEGIKQTGLQNLQSYGGSKVCYYNAQGQMQYGLQTVDGVTYGFNNDSGAMLVNSEGWFNGHSYYFGQDGAMQTGFVKLSDGRTVYYNNQGQMVYGTQFINGSWYNFNWQTGAMQTNIELDINGYWYFLGADGADVSGLVTLPDGRVAYYNTKGQMHINGVTYGFDVQTGAMIKNGQGLFGGYWYDFDGQGAMQTGFVTLADGRVVYYNAQGQMQYGIQTINGVTYGFNTVTGALLTSTEQYIDGYWYDFNAQGIMQTGFVTLPDGRVVYYDAKGHMLFGEQVIDGVTYEFNPATGAEMGI